MPLEVHKMTICLLNIGNFVHFKEQVLLHLSSFFKCRGAKSSMTKKILAQGVRRVVELS